MKRPVIREHDEFERAKLSTESSDFGERVHGLEAMIGLALGGKTPAKGWAQRFMRLRFNTIVTVGENDNAATQAAG